MNATIRTMRPIDWVGFVILVVFVSGVLVVGCGDDDDAEDIQESEWTVTKDPYGREWACLNVITGAYTGGGLFCVPAPEAP